MVRIRLSRVGRKHKSLFRLVACNQRSPRDGKALEILGQYDPCEADDMKKLNFKPDRVKYWLSVGAQASDRVWNLLRKRGINKANFREPSAATVS